MEAGGFEEAGGLVLRGCGKKETRKGRARVTLNLNLGLGSRLLTHFRHTSVLDYECDGSNQMST